MVQRDIHISSIWNKGEKSVAHLEQPHKKKYINILQPLACNIVTPWITTQIGSVVRKNYFIAFITLFCLDAISITIPAENK